MMARLYSSLQLVAVGAACSLGGHGFGPKARKPPPFARAPPTPLVPLWPWLAHSMDVGEFLSPSTTCPLGCVETIMRGSPSHGETVLSATPGESLQALIPRLAKVRGAMHVHDHEAMVACERTCYMCT
jgi:hypothetical protein